MEPTQWFLHDMFTMESNGVCYNAKIIHSSPQELFLLTFWKMQNFLSYQILLDRLVGHYLKAILPVELALMN